jgi:hypothetical protein
MKIVSPPGDFQIRLLQLNSMADGCLYGGMGRVESQGHLFDGLGAIFYGGGGCGVFNFTDKVAHHFGISLSAQSPVSSTDGHMYYPIATSPFRGYAQIVATSADFPKPRYAEISEELRQKLAAIPAATYAGNAGLAYRPCQVLLKNGKWVDRVYVVPEDPYILSWGVWPEEDHAKKHIRIEDVTAIEESRFRLPARFASKLYEAGESGMGYHIYTVVFDDGLRMAFLSGNAIDFIEYPEGKGPANVVDVLPHIGRDDLGRRESPNYTWCLYSEEA